MALKDHLVPPKGTYTPYDPVEQRAVAPYQQPVIPPLQTIDPDGPDPFLRSSSTPLKSASPDSLSNFYRSGVQNRRSIPL